MLDGHIHIFNKTIDKAGLAEKFSEAGINGGIILSLPPETMNFGYFGQKERLDNLLECKEAGSNLYPFYWINPIEKDALEQVKLAEEYGVRGFKIICNNFYPDDKKAFRVFEAIAGINRPILFHSGILWDGAVSSQYNRPAGFEALLQIDGLKFSLAHASWPWIDECIALYGKIQNAYSRRPDLSVEMFIDITPGTPPIYREELLTKLFKVGYDVQNNIIFGSDCNLDNYNSKWTKDWVKRDNEIYDKLSIGTDVKKKVFSENLKRFLGLDKQPVKKNTLLPGI
ncbi:putative TIM-barrel fold metal-dependent hydrolase [Ruminiclostridium sufflavum DSM 19573]|uniref:Putative TIM-barrel fold metal-dependent hydrolase n=1 Tax=Ruminiclostridium sufflavum DSM 19573 TaxID=1121337 RepID=A0A318Y067_9FIRM|nr:amidohydrolase family protein [Ruminiclostridium sufflavum]PYG88724.1 putative TIM-barrel fold metal-dependent hydrolase [Ruminiclostridium sufflavum DSM 19573]